MAGTSCSTDQYGRSLRYLKVAGSSPVALAATTQLGQLPNKWGELAPCVPPDALFKLNHDLLIVPSSNLQPPVHFNFQGLRALALPAYNRYLSLFKHQPPAALRRQPEPCASAPKSAQPVAAASLTGAHTKTATHAGRSRPWSSTAIAQRGVPNDPSTSIVAKSSPGPTWTRHVGAGILLCARAAKWIVLELSYKHLK